MEFEKLMLKSAMETFEKLPAGALLVKTVGKDDGSGDYAVELHGVRDEQGRILILSEKLTKPGQDAG